MSTEKSLLTLGDVKFPKIDHGDEKDGLFFPVGVTPCGNLEVAHLSHDEGTTHACLFGVCGSGKTKCVEFVLKALHQMYGSDITFYFLDGKGCEYTYWSKQNMPFKMTRDCSTLESFGDAIDEVLHYVAGKTSEEPELVVIDDASEHVFGQRDGLRMKLYNLYIEGSRKNVQLLWSSQVPRGRLNDVRDYFGLTCATRVHHEDSDAIFGSDVASKVAGVRRYGDLTYSFNGSVSRVRVPFCENQRKENPYD